jgi:hypothetical protein
MAIIFGSATVPASTTGTFLFQVPPGISAVTFYNPGVQPIYVGSNTATSLGGSPASGFLIPWTAQTAYPVTIPGFAGSAGTKVYGATAGTASTYATTLQYILSTNT